MIPYSDDSKVREELKKYIPVIFLSVDQRIHCAFICKKTDIFNTIENLLYQKYPQYKETENIYTLGGIGGKIINKYKTFEENNVKYSDIILLNVNYKLQFK